MGDAPLGAAVALVFVLAVRRDGDDADGGARRRCVRDHDRLPRLARRPCRGGDAVVVVGGAAPVVLPLLLLLSGSSGVLRVRRRVFLHSLLDGRKVTGCFLVAPTKQYT